MSLKTDLKLLLPLRDIHVTQPFGVNFADFYKGMGMVGHNGVDFLAADGCKILASHDGVVTFAGMDGDGGISITLTNAINGTGYKTIYYHLKECLVKVGDKVKQGQIIGLSDNTGKYTHGSHLHFGLKFLTNGKVDDYNNGYFGAVDPAPYFANMHGPKWYEPAAYHRYGRNQDWLAEFNTRFKNVWLHRKLKSINKLNAVNDTIFINKIVYGGYSFDEAINQAMNQFANHIKKDDFNKGIRPFV